MSRIQPQHDPEHFGTKLVFALGSLHRVLRRAHQNGLDVIIMEKLAIYFTDVLGNFRYATPRADLAHLRQLVGSEDVDP